MKEFIVLMAFLMAMVALTIDAMLPALGIMADDLQVVDPNNIQYVVSCIFMGLAVGQLIYGPLSDRWGRKPLLLAGLLLLIVGSLISYFAQDLTMMLAGRVIQGLGASAPRILTMAVVRDRFEGRIMAKTMSMIMGVFILVPALAPTIGQAIINLSGWREIFLFYVVSTALAIIWMLLRLDETLPKEKRRALTWASLKRNILEIVNNRQTVGYTICSGLVFSILLGYLNSAQQIFYELFDAGEDFPLYFGALALAIGAAFFTNSALVQKHGMHKITASALVALTVVAGIFMTFGYVVEPPLWTFMVFAAIAFFCLGLTFGNMNAMALEPMGHIAGLASAFIGSLATAVSIVGGTILGQFYDGTLHPLSIGFFALGAGGLLLMIWTEKGVKNIFLPRHKND